MRNYMYYLKKEIISYDWLSLFIQIIANLNFAFFGYCLREYNKTNDDLFLFVSFTFLISGITIFFNNYKRNLKDRL